MKAIFEFLKALLSYLGLVKERSNKEFDIKNSEEYKKKEEKIVVTKRADENEKLVAGIDGKDDEAALNEIRKRIAK